MKQKRGKAPLSVLLFGMVGFYIMIGLVFAFLISEQVIVRDTLQVINMSEDRIFHEKTMKSLQTAENFFNNNFIRTNGHIDLYLTVEDNNTIIIHDDDTNSEAVSYYLLWTAQQKDKDAFDKGLSFIQNNMIHPTHNYLMWRLTANDTIESDGSNIASDADLRVIKALTIAQYHWPDDPAYASMINQLTGGLENVALTKDVYLAPYGGVSGETSVWLSKEVWLSYTDFTVLQYLSEQRGGVWTTVYNNMKQAVLESQIQNGLYNSMLTQERKYGNGIDNGGYSINSMWIMVRNAESNDPELQASALKSLSFYKERYELDGELFQKYGSDSNALIRDESPWVYALVGRAAVELGDEEFSKIMLQHLMDNQVSDQQSPLYGAIPESKDIDDRRIGQFTMQESILTMQAFILAQGDY